MERTRRGQNLKDQLKNDKIHCLVAFNNSIAFEQYKMVTNNNIRPHHC